MSGRRLRGGHRFGVLGVVAAAVVTLSSTVALAQEPGPAPGMVAGTPCTVTARACADLIGLRAWLLDGGRIVRGPVPISIGAEGDSETPPGRYRVEWKNRDHISGESGAPMPFAVFFAPGGIAFHEGNLQTNSAGCIRLAHDEAAAFFDFLQVGDEVQVHSDPLS